VPGGGVLTYHFACQFGGPVRLPASAAGRCAEIAAALSSEWTGEVGQAVTCGAFGELLADGDCEAVIAALVEYVVRGTPGRAGVIRVVGRCSTRAQCSVRTEQVLKSARVQC